MLGQSSQCLCDVTVRSGVSIEGQACCSRSELAQDLRGQPPGVHAGQPDGWHTAHVGSQVGLEHTSVMRTTDLSSPCTEIGIWTGAPGLAPPRAPRQLLLQVEEILLLETSPANESVGLRPNQAGDYVGVSLRARSARRVASLAPNVIEVYSEGAAHDGYNELVRRHQPSTSNWETCVARGAVSHFGANDSIELTNTAETENAVVQAFQSKSMHGWTDCV